MRFSYQSDEEFYEENNESKSDGEYLHSGGEELKNRAAQSYHRALKINSITIYFVYTRDYDLLVLRRRDFQPRSKKHSVL